ncbi:WD40 repeat-like protein, partial [Favolaschia claudopus]
GVTSVAFSPDGSRVVSGSRDQTVRIWDASAGAAWATSVAFSPNSSRVVGSQMMRSPGPWVLQTDGWVVVRGHPHFRLFWHNPGLQATLLSPQCLLSISNRARTHLHVNVRYLGPDWETIY